MPNGARVLLIHPDTRRALQLSLSLRASGWEVCGITPTIDAAARLAEFLRPTVALTNMDALPATDAAPLLGLIEAGVVPVIMSVDEKPQPVLELLHLLFRRQRVYPGKRLP